MGTDKVGCFERKIKQNFSTLYLNKLMFTPKKKNDVIFDTTCKQQIFVMLL